MPRPQLLLAVLIASVCCGAAVQRPMSLEERARFMNDARAAIEDSSTPSSDLFRRYFDVFPSSFAEIGELFFVPGRHRELLSRSKEWDHGGAYTDLMCKTYEHVDRRGYMRKVLRIGVEADKWGDPAKDPERFHYPGDVYLSLLFGGGAWCGTLTEVSLKERSALILALMPEFTDGEVEAIYNSISWTTDFIGPVEWFLVGLCERDPKRCDLAQRMRVRSVEHLNDADH